VERVRRRFGESLGVRFTDLVPLHTLESELRIWATVARDYQHAHNEAIEGLDLHYQATPITSSRFEVVCLNFPEDSTKRREKERRANLRRLQREDTREARRRSRSRGA
jgi:hypothetical protein